MRILRRERMRQMSTAQWTDENPVLFEGEQAYDTTMDNYKTGDGITHWLLLKWDRPILSASTPAIAPAGTVWLKPAP